MLFSPLTAPVISAIIVFMVVFSFVFILLLTFKPHIVRRCVDGIPVAPCEADTGKCVIGATLIALLVLLISWAARGCLRRDAV
jgi:hypothetical protein